MIGLRRGSAGGAAGAVPRLPKQRGRPGLGGRCRGIIEAPRGNAWRRRALEAPDTRRREAASPDWTGRRPASPSIAGRYILSRGGPGGSVDSYSARRTDAIRAAARLSRALLSKRPSLSDSRAAQLVDGPGLRRQTSRLARGRPVTRSHLQATRMRRASDGGGPYTPDPPGRRRPGPRQRPGPL